MRIIASRRTPSENTEIVTKTPGERLVPKSLSCHFVNPFYSIENIALNGKLFLRQLSCLPKVKWLILKR